MTVPEDQRQQRIVIESLNENINRINDIMDRVNALKIVMDRGKFESTTYIAMMDDFAFALGLEIDTFKKTY